MPIWNKSIAQRSIVYLGYSSFPNGRAEVQKLIMISKSLILADNKVTIICRNGRHDRSTYPALKPSGEFEGIHYLYASGSFYRSNNFFRRRLYEIRGKINEFLVLYKMKRKNQLDYAILSTRRFGSVLYYVGLSKILGFKTVLNYVEYYSAFKKRKSQFSQRVNDKLFDRLTPRMVNAVFPISEFLIDHISKVAPGKPYLKVPILTDLNKYNSVKVLHDEPYFLFCGDAGYKEIVFFIIDSFSLLKTKIPYYLYLIVNGKREDVEEIKGYVNRLENAKGIKIFSDLSEGNLYSLYKNAKALLIPLRPTLQDAARFPHKTGEYLASGNPVISTNYGEMKFYFRDGENMLLADKYDKNLFAKKMQFIIDHPEVAKAIGVRGKDMVKELFDFKRQSPVINRFLESLS
jgi:glycosyltransferase involved in cell wall biosynthesis